MIISKVLGITAGNGVSLYPFKSNLIGNIEPRPIFSTKGDKQWNLNFPKIPFDYSLLTRYRKDSVDIIIGHPDCGHSSNLSYSRAKKLSNPKENMSFSFFVENVNYYQPKVFLMENLPNLLKNIDSIDDLFPDYNLKYFTESVSIWGNSQVSRIRLILIGLHKDFDEGFLRYIRLPNKSQEVRTSGELIDDLNYPDPDLCHIREHNDTSICLYLDHRRNITVEEAQILWSTKYKGLKKWPVNNGKLKNQPGVYRNLEHLPPLSVTKSNRQFRPDGYLMTPRELARYQGIPDEFKLWFDEDPVKRVYCLNKARATVAKTPPMEISKWFYSVIKNLESKFL